jgi:hypothetical protein
VRKLRPISNLLKLFKKGNRVYILFYIEKVIYSKFQKGWQKEKIDFQLDLT